MRPKLPRSSPQTGDGAEKKARCLAERGVVSSDLLVYRDWRGYEPIDIHIYDTGTMYLTR
jgi:hypothetical protein